MRLSLMWHRHWRLVVSAVALLSVLVFALGGWRVSAASSSHEREPAGTDVAGTVGLFDPSVVHTLAVTFDPAEYRGAIEAFARDGEKVDIEADVVIDGTPVESVGIRLKGNSTLFGLAGSDREGGPQAPALGGSGTASADSPGDLPWLIDFDQFVEGRTYQGHELVAVRPGGMGSAQTTALNEALALTLIGLAGEPAEEAAYAAFSVNGSAPTLRLLVQSPDDSFADSALADEGVLYKALAGTTGGSFAYAGEDPLAYEVSFRQVTKKNQEDLAPLIEFIRWVEESSDEEFAAGLGDRLDVESFARYLALHNLLLDADDMSGPGQNYYLFYDLGSQRFRVVTWDANSTFRGDAAQGPYDSGTIGGPDGAQPGQGGGVQPGQGGFPGGARPPGGMEPPGGPTPPEGVTPPEGFTSPEATPGETGELAANSEVGGGAQVPGVGPPPGGRGPGGVGMGGHLLKERFLEAEEFQAAYEEAYGDLYRQLFAGGAALAALEEWTAVLATAEGDLVDASTLAGEVAQLREIIEARTEALATEEVIAG